MGNTNTNANANANANAMNKIEEKPVVIVAKPPLPSNVIEID